MAELKKTPDQKRAYEKRLLAIRESLPGNPAAELNAFCRYTQRDTFEPEHVYNVLRTPVRRYDDAILESLEKMVKTLKAVA